MSPCPLPTRRRSPLSTRRSRVSERPGRSSRGRHREAEVGEGRRLIQRPRPILPNHTHSPFRRRRAAQVLARRAIGATERCPSAMGLQPIVRAPPHLRFLIERPRPLLPNHPRSPSCRQTCALPAAQHLYPGRFALPPSLPSAVLRATTCSPWSAVLSVSRRSHPLLAVIRQGGGARTANSTCQRCAAQPAPRAESMEAMHCGRLLPAPW